MNKVQDNYQTALRFAVVVLEGENLPAWQSDCIRSLTAKPALELVAVVEDGFWAERTSIPYEMVRRLICRPTTERSVRMIDDFSGVETFRISIGDLLPVDRNELVRGISENIDQLNLDFVLDFRPGVEKSSLLTGGRFGVWAFDFGGRPGAGDPVLADLRGGHLTTRARLKRFDEETGDWSTLMSGEIRTTAHSPGSTVDSVLASASKWPELVFNKLLKDPSSGRSASVGGENIHEVQHAGITEALTLLGRTIIGFSWRIRRAFFVHDQWNIGIVKSPIQSFLDADFQPEIEWIPDLPTHCFRADPFGVTVNQDRVLFFEQLDYREKRGKIRYIQFRGDSLSAEGEVDLDTDVHLSYPYVFTYEDDIYCVPETYEAGEIALYRATAFPSKWEKIAILVDNFPGADASLFMRDDRWWLACTRVGDGSNDKLHLWYADDIKGPWSPHSGNPVKIDARSARPAGTPFWHAGTLYRPAQDSSGSYGGRIVINRVDELTPDSFAEQSIVIVGPFVDSVYPDGFHTISAMGDWTVIDARRSMFDSRAFIGAARRGFTNLLARLHVGKRVTEQRPL